MLLPAFRKVKIFADEQHAIFAHELQSALRLTAGVWNFYCELYQIRHSGETSLHLNILN